MDKFTDTVANSIIAALKNKLKPLEAQGISVNIVEPKYSDICMEARIILTLTNATQEAEAERKRYFLENCASVGLREDHYGKVFKPTTSVHDLKIVGLDFHDENPVLIQQDDDNTQFYRMSVADVKRFL